MSSGRRASSVRERMRNGNGQDPQRWCPSVGYSGRVAPSAALAALAGPIWQAKKINAQVNKIWSITTSGTFPLFRETVVLQNKFSSIMAQTQITAKKQQGRV